MSAFVYTREQIAENVTHYKDAELRERKLNEFVHRIVLRIPFPKTEKLIERIALNDYYYDLTFLDFSDDKLIQELHRKKLMEDEDIRGIVELKNAFAERR